MHAATSAFVFMPFKPVGSVAPFAATSAAPVPVPAPASAPLRRRDDAQAAALIDGFSSRGGLASGDEMAQRMRATWRQPISELARWIVARRVLSFSWRGQLLLPLFQFHLPRVAPCDGVVAASAELLDLFDDPGLAEWFLQPSDWLCRTAPADLVLTDADAVVGAARSTRLAAAAAGAGRPS